jgi:enoyl-CoA hydratase/carnithine racemase
VSHEALIRRDIENHVVTLTFLREKQLNALNTAVLQELDGHLNEIASDSEVRVVVLRGQGRAFVAGADISEMQHLSAAQGAEFARLGQSVFRKLEQLTQPTVALIHGYALGGGMELAMACDVRIAAEGTRFGQPEVTLGVIPGFGGSQRLPRIIGQGNALRLLLTGDLIGAEEALRLGLVSEVVPADDLHAAGLKLTTKLAALPPKALGWMKQAVYEGAEVDLGTGLGMEAALFGLCFSTDDQTEGMAAFLEKRKPTFEGK